MATHPNHHEEGGLKINGIPVRDTYAEAFGMWATRLVITAASPQWARTAAAALTGFATSVIGCKVEAGVEAELEPRESPDGRPGVAVLLMAFNAEELGKRVVERVGQTVLTCATSACFDGLPDSPERVALGKVLRFFGDGHQSSKLIEGRRYWRIPVMDGEFLCEESVGAQKAIGGGNFLVLAASVEAALHSAEAAVLAMRHVPGVVLPFPGGIVRSGSKVGARRYKKLIASTNDAFCPTLRVSRRVKSELPEGVNCVLEIVVNGLDRASIQAALRAGIEAACRPGVVEISAGNYGGKLGKHLFPLRELFPGATP